MSSGNIIHCGYEGFVAGETESGTFKYANNLADAKIFSDAEIEKLYPELSMDHPASETSILTLEEAQSMKFERLQIK